MDESNPLHSRKGFRNPEAAVQQLTPNAQAARASLAAGQPPLPTIDRPDDTRHLTMLPPISNGQPQSKRHHWQGRQHPGRDHIPSSDH
ncbi:hypothetical protein PCASD_18325 [Puccinia coronata f. sp. avenae]|uniref:Uncharacterized protein n=1 Tax=Puccinia coronata f. sp. avenae TaxID=200324 RepID=A0A2N5T449_9BASI|nr:hypothetical protein PCASD_18325 [Puccinia coronata f. sp. avenae]